MKVAILGVNRYAASFLKKILERNGHEVIVEGASCSDAAAEKKCFDPEVIVHFRQEGPFPDPVPERGPSLALRITVSSLRAEEKECLISREQDSQRDGVRRVEMRIGILLTSREGLIPAIRPFFVRGIGGVIGKGEEPFPWIYLEDLVEFVAYVLENESISGEFDVVAPQEITSRDFSRAFASVLHKPLWLRWPKILYRLIPKGDLSMILVPFKTSSEKILSSGFEFRYPAIYPALVDMMNTEK